MGTEVSMERKARVDRIVAELRTIGERLDHVYECTRDEMFPAQNAVMSLTFRRYRLEKEIKKYIDFVYREMPLKV